MKLRFFVLFTIIFLFAFCQGQQEHNCPLPQLQHGKDDLCGFIEVLRNRNKPENGKTQIAYLVIKSKSKNPKADPVLFVQGGPGGVVLPLAQEYAGLSLDIDRDFILFDQRGTGFSQPLCPGLSKELMTVLSLDLPANKEFGELTERLETCREESKGKSVRLSEYNTSENASDIEDLRKHLGYKKWNLFGGSYGSRLALIYMNRFPDAVRSATLMGIFPPQVRLYENIITNFNESLNRLFTSCEEDPHCDEKYPGLKQAFFETYHAVKGRPVTYEWNNTTFTLNAQDMLLFIQQMLYDRESIAAIPLFINAIKAGKADVLSGFTDSFNQRMDFLNSAVYWSVMACDEAGLNNIALLQADLKRNPQFETGIAFFLSDPYIFNNWQGDSSCFVELQTVHSDIPTLFVSGSFDPVTPPSNADIAASTLTRAHLITFENEGHSIFNDCFFDIAHEFLDDPMKSPGSECVQREDTIRWR